MTIRTLFFGIAAIALSLTTVAAAPYHCPPAGTKLVNKSATGIEHEVIYKGGTPGATADSPPLCTAVVDGKEYSRVAGRWNNNDAGRAEEARFMRLLAGGPGTTETWRVTNTLQNQAWDNRLSFDSVGNMQIGNKTRDVFMFSLEQKGVGPNWFHGIWHYTYHRATMALVKFGYQHIAGYPSSVDAFTAVQITGPGE
jgi:hypothetical protein